MKFLKLFFPILALGLLIACDDDDDTDTPAPNPCGDDIEFCMEHGGRSLSGDAVLEQLGENHFRINFTHTAGDHEEIQIDIYGDEIARYEVDTTNRPATASFEYFTDSIGGTLYGAEGFVELVSVRPDDEGITGSFEITLDDSTEVTNGYFTDVDQR